MSTLGLRNLRKAYGDVTVVADLSLDIADGEFVVFVGPSGCGKSTLIRMIAGLEEITGGELTIDGVRANDVGPADRGLAMVFQSYALYPHMTVRENMGFALRMAGVPRAERDRKVLDAARILRLEDYLDKKPGQLSGGQRQRVAIGRAIVRNPKVFLFDEPLSNLDAALRGQMRVELARLHADLGATMIYVTHDQVEAMTMADRIVVLRDGRIEQVGAPLDIYRRPANLFVAGFIGSPTMNLLPASVVGLGASGCTVSLPGGGELAVAADVSALAVGDSLTLGIRPEGLRPAAEGVLAGVVTVVEQLGALSLVHAQLDPATEVIAQLAGSEAFHHGDPIRLAVDAAHCHLFDAAGTALHGPTSVG
jgi:multiple sugar transport system ATP-binding protein